MPYRKAFHSLEHSCDFRRQDGVTLKGWKSLRRCYTSLSRTWKQFIETLFVLASLLLLLIWIRSFRHTQRQSWLKLRREIKKTVISWLKVRRNQENGELMVETTKKSRKQWTHGWNDEEKGRKRWTHGWNYEEIKKTVDSRLKPRREIKKTVKPLLKLGRNQENGDLMVETREKSRKQWTHGWN